MGSPFYAATVDEFMADLCNGRVQGVSPRPALTRDIFDLYRIWCRRKRIPALSGVAPLVKLLCERQAIHVLRKRYAIDGEVFGPHGMLFLSAPPPPRPGYECDWLGEHVTAFRAAVDAYAQLGAGAAPTATTLELVK